MTPSRADPTSLVPAARALYEQGRSCSQVLEAIYGVDLPREASLFRRDFIVGAKPISALFTVHPWELMIPLDEGGPSYSASELSIRDEVRAYLQAPRVVLVGRIIYGCGSIASAETRSNSRG
jgi:hypothetical protein